ncbi:MAG: DUF3443 family protein [Burkholderiaceae bacterium]
MTNAITTASRWRLRCARALALLGLTAVLAACGGESWNDDDDGSGQGPEVSTNTSAAVNVVPVVIDGGPSGNAVNVPFVSLTICTPGSTTQCQTIDHILLDTGSTGLRLISSVLTGAATPAAHDTAAGAPLAECFAYVDGTVWGRLAKLDVEFGGERLSSVPVHLIGDQTSAELPDSDCPGPYQNTVADFGANGILGISTFLQDCGTQCAAAVSSSYYFRCPADGCVKTTVALADQVNNPAALLAGDNNGVIVTLPSVPAGGASKATGALILGINTRDNNALAATTPILTLSPTTGYLSATYKGATLVNSFFDTGSNFYFFNDSSIPECTASDYDRFYCPLSPQSISTTVTGGNGVTNTVSFSLVNAYTVHQANWLNDVFDGFGVTSSLASSFDFGAPFFFGRSVYTAFEGEDGAATNVVGGVAGPWIAF